MALWRSPRNLPGADPLLLQRILTAIYLALAAVMLALDLATVVEIGAQHGHLPWPIAQVALTTPPGALVVGVVGGLVWGLPFVSLARSRPLNVRPVDVTDLPLDAWPRPLPTPHEQGRRTLADTWLGYGRRQRALSLLALALAASLLIGLVVAVVASAWYTFTHFPDCDVSGCSPTFTEQLTTLPELIGLGVMLLSLWGRITYLERRCGVWFRGRSAVENVGTYIRRPGVTPEAAAAALQRYTRSASPRTPTAQVILLSLLTLTPAMLVMSAGLFLSTWLSTQWIPG